MLGTKDTLQLYTHLFGDKYRIQWHSFEEELKRLFEKKSILGFSRIEFCTQDEWNDEEMLFLDDGEYKNIYFHIPRTTAIDRLNYISKYRKIKNSLIIESFSMSEYEENYDDENRIGFEVFNNSYPKIIRKLGERMFFSGNPDAGMFSLRGFINCRVYDFLANTCNSIITWYQHPKYRDSILAPVNIELGEMSCDSNGFDIIHDLLFGKDEFDNDEFINYIINEHQYIHYFEKWNFYYKFSEKKARIQVDTNQLNNIGRLNDSKYNVMFEDDRSNDSDISLYPITRSIAKERLHNLLKAGHPQYIIEQTNYEYDNRDITYLTFTVTSKKYSCIFRFYSLL